MHRGSIPERKSFEIAWYRIIRPFIIHILIRIKKSDDFLMYPVIRPKEFGTNLKVYHYFPNKKGIIETGPHGKELSLNMHKKRFRRNEKLLFG